MTTRRGFLGALAGAALITIAARTGFARTELVLSEPPEWDLEFLADHLTGKDAWYLVTTPKDGLIHRQVITDQHIENLPALDITRFKGRIRASIDPNDWRGLYGSSS